jgi:hypothetical protein
MSQGIFNCEVLLERLEELGYDGGKSISSTWLHKKWPAAEAADQENFYIVSLSSWRGAVQLSTGFLHLI